MATRKTPKPTKAQIEEEYRKLAQFLYDMYKEKKRKDRASSPRAKADSDA